MGVRTFVDSVSPFSFNLKFKLTPHNSTYLRPTQAFILPYKESGFHQFKGTQLWLLFSLLQIKKETMLREVECLQHVRVPTQGLNANRMVSTSSVATHLLRQLTMCKALEEIGYILGVTKLNAIVKGEKSDCAKHVNFLVSFNCRTLLPMKGEVMFGIVHTISRFGVFLKSGPMKIVYLSTRKMPNYYFVDEGKPLFMSNDLSRIEKDVVIRFVVLATRWSQRTRDISVLASIEGDSFGPVATAGLDGFEL